MTPQYTYNLTVRLSANIATPPANDREHFRQSAITTLLSVMKECDVSVDYIKYSADPVGLHHLESKMVEYEDSVYASLSLHYNPFLLNETHIKKETLVKAFVDTFENRTQRHLEVESAIEDSKSHNISIEMCSDWKRELNRD